MAVIDVSSAVPATGFIHEWRVFVQHVPEPLLAESWHAEPAGRTVPRSLWIYRAITISAITIWAITI